MSGAVEGAYGMVLDAERDDGGCMEGAEKDCDGGEGEEGD